jgi:adenosylcobinamide amidohydrolase
LKVRFSEPRRSLGWSLLHPGFATAKDVVCVELRDRDLPPSIHPCAFLKTKVAEAGIPHALAFMTSRNILRHHFGLRRVEGVEVYCLATVGLSNGERFGTRRSVRSRAGTINILVCLSCSLTDGALVEALSIAAQARTAAIIETRPPDLQPVITGTGTDCIVVAAPCGAIRLLSQGCILQPAKPLAERSAMRRAKAVSSGMPNICCRRISHWRHSPSRHEEGVTRLVAKSHFIRKVVLTAEDRLKVAFASCY